MNGRVLTRAGAVLDSVPVLVKAALGMAVYAVHNAVPVMFLIKRCPDTV